MKKILNFTMLAMIISAPSIAFAGEQTIKLSVPDMSCASCPYMVKQAISMVDGIKIVEATMEDRSATVTFDDALTNVDEIREATASIGYRSTVIQTN